MRIISRLDIKNEFVIKGINLEGLRKVGNPIELASKYYEENIDEIIYVDAIASLYRKNTLSNLIYETSKKIFVLATSQANPLGYVLGCWLVIISNFEFINLLIIRSIKPTSKKGLSAQTLIKDFKLNLSKQSKLLL